MLSEHEQRTLQELEARIAGADAAFVRSFAARQDRMSNSRRQRVSDVVVLIGVPALGVGTIVAGSLSAALQLVIAAELAWFLWHSSTLPSGSDDPGIRN